MTQTERSTSTEDLNRQLSQLVMAPVLAHATCMVAELGIPDLIDPGSDKSVTDIASAAGCDTRTLYRVMRFLASHGIFEERSDQRFGLPPLANALRTDAEASFRPAARMFARLLPSLSAFEHSLRTGESALTKTLGESLFQYMMTRPDEARIFDAAMSSFHAPEARAMLEAYDFAGIRTLADVGGGNGSLLIEVLTHNPDLKGLLFDLDHVAANARQNIEAAGLADRCSVQEGSFFESVPSGADAYLLRHIIHDWSDEDSIRILRNCRKAVPESGRLVIVETVVPADNAPSPAKDMDMTMLLYPGGMERTEVEYRDLFARSGFEFAGITPTKSAVSVIEGRAS